MGDASYDAGQAPRGGGFDRRCTRGAIPSGLFGAMAFDPGHARSMLRGRLIGLVIFDPRYMRPMVRGGCPEVVIFDPSRVRERTSGCLLGVITSELCRMRDTPWNRFLELARLDPRYAQYWKRGHLAGGRIFELRRTRALIRGRLLEAGELDS